MDRLEHLRQTLPKNVAVLEAGMPDAELVLLDYGSRQDVCDWTLDNAGEAIRQGRLKLYRTDEPQHYDSSHAKNVAHRLGSGEILCNLDADQFLTREYLSDLQARFAIPVAPLVHGGKKSKGRVALEARTFYAIGGYNEEFEGYGDDDVDLIERARRFANLDVQTSAPQTMRLILHDDELRTRNMKETDRDKHESLRRNRSRMRANLRAERLIANIGKEWGRASVRRIAKLEPQGEGVIAPTSSETTSATLRAASELDFSDAAERRLRRTRRSVAGSDEVEAAFPVSPASNPTSATSLQDASVDVRLVLPELTLVTFADKRTFTALAENMPTWIELRPELRSMRKIVFVAKGEAPPSGLSSLCDAIPNLGPVAVEAGPAEMGRNRWTEAYFCDVAKLVSTPWFIRIEPETQASASGPVWRPEFLAPVDGLEPIRFVASPWSYSRRHEAIAELDVWGDRLSGLAPYPSLSSRLSDDREGISSWIFFGDVAWTREVAPCVEASLPVHDHETLAWYLARRRGDSFRRLRLKSHGWRHSFAKLDQDEVKGQAPNHELGGVTTEGLLIAATVHSHGSGEGPRPRFSFCITCMDRLEHLRQTLPENLKTLESEMPDAELVLLDYGSRQDVCGWTQENARDALLHGRLKLYRTDSPQHYVPSPAKNLAHRLGSGEILCNLDADQFLTTAYLQDLRDRFAAPVAPIVHGGRKSTGRVALESRTFYAIGGYDEEFEGWGDDDIDLIERARRFAGLDVQESAPRTMRQIRHGDELRTQNMKMADRNKFDSLRRNRRRMKANLRAGHLVANVGKAWGSAIVKRVFVCGTQTEVAPLRG